MKIVFFGSDDFAAVHLNALFDSTHEVVGCVTQPDKPKGRGMKVIVSPIKSCALDHNVEVLQPIDLRDEPFLDQLKSFRADLFIVIAYGRFLPQEVLDIPALDTINVHGSLLPKYRGAAPINWVVINGGSKSGLSIIKVIKQMDAGDIVAEKLIKIDSTDTSQTLRLKMMDVGPKFLVGTLKNIKENLVKANIQNEEKVSLAPKLTKELGRIDWKKSSDEIHNLIRGLLPWPCAYTHYKGKTLKIKRSQVVECDRMCPPGEVIEIQKDGFVVHTGEKGLLVQVVHLEASKEMEARAFIAGHHLEVGHIFQD